MGIRPQRDTGRTDAAEPGSRAEAGPAPWCAAVAAGLALSIAMPAPAAAQGRANAPPPGTDSATVVVGPRYEAGGLRRALLGSRWRDVWLTPVDAAVFDFDRHAGGVRWTRRGGGNMSITLHLEALDGHPEYIFRSAQKYPEQGMPSALRGTAAGWVLEDLMSSLFPAAPLLVPPFTRALDLLHVEPELRVMPADPRLAGLRDTLAGMPGTVEPMANEGPDDDPGFAGSRKVKGTEEFLDDLEDSREHRLDERAFLRARLLDIFINDTDRTSDNMRWARFGEDGAYRWLPVPIDRDFAFIDADGLVAKAFRRVFPKFVRFGAHYPDIDAYTYSSHLLDRRLLQRLTRADFETAAREVRRAITDDVIEEAIARLPERWRAETDAPERLRTILRARRAGLDRMATAFYDALAATVDVRATDQDDRVALHRHADGRVRVTITGPDDETDDEGDEEGEGHPGPFFDRTFLPDETREIRVYLHGGDDRATVTGAATRAIVLRVIGGGGDDTLFDGAGGGATHLYDARGDNAFSGGPDTHVSTSSWEPPTPTEGLRLGGAWVPDWGVGEGWTAALDYGDASGVVLGVGRQWTRYGFRRMPHDRKAELGLLWSTRHGSLGAEAAVDYRLENSPVALLVDARAVPFSSLRFAGYGNDTPDPGEDGLVVRDLLRVRPAVAWHIGWRARETGGTLVGADEAEPSLELRPLVGRVDFGPILLWTDPHPAPGSPLALIPGADETSARAGIRTDLTLDHTSDDAAPRLGWRLATSATAWPSGGSLPRAFVEADATVAGYVPLAGVGPHLALRAGGSIAGSGAPPEHSPWVGGRTTVRGYRWQRFRGDRAAFGSVELRVPVAPVEIGLRWRLGVFGLADAGRVWVDGSSPGGWHTGVGGGVWLAALGRAVSLAYAHGEEDRVYLQLGLSY